MRRVGERTGGDAGARVDVARQVEAAACAGPVAAWVAEMPAIPRLNGTIIEGSARQAGARRQDTAVMAQTSTHQHGKRACSSEARCRYGRAIGQHTCHQAAARPRRLQRHGQRGPSRPSDLDRRVRMVPIGAELMGTSLRVVDTAHRGRTASERNRCASSRRSKRHITYATSAIYSLTAQALSGEL